MTRHSKAIEINGWLVVDKKAGYTSTAVTNKVRWLLNARKAGHAGTLDPDATGILAIALGQATKTIPYLINAQKTYQFKVNFGSATDTDDVSGKIIKQSHTKPTDDQLNSILKKFTGSIKQIPPRYSAIKINGTRAYKLSRAGIADIKLKSRSLLVEKLEIIKRLDDKSIIMEMTCGKGGYVRSIARDIGDVLGCFAHAGDIRRISSGPFTLLNSISSETIFKENRLEISNNIMPVQSSLHELIRIDCMLSEASEIKNGKKILLDGDYLEENAEAFICLNNNPIAIGKINNNYFYPKKVLSFVTNQ